MAKTVHLIVDREGLNVNVEKCTLKSSPLISRVVTLTCSDDTLILAVLKLVESGVPATVLASYPCGPAGPLGEVINLAPAPCASVPIKGTFEAYCSDPHVCRQLTWVVFRARARKLEFTRVGNVWMVRAKIAEEGYLDLKTLKRVNSRSLKAIILNPIRVPPLVIDSKVTTAESLKPSDL